ncbi:glycosyltransferase family 2 protein [Butyrivibrio sp.]|uniref:glycosyltransferase family 2 protein n=1 Tax=Butyrivibrio sp. TaxID=28121 RepID=UPI0025BD8052|nr:glycosyltransferase family 2 protein [Butyrivibrio sp.]MBQ7430031.1 glycosyltransferase family 2 protein [Butyrivibrio sp.]MBQ9303043.1 glycosyltransferase family 2 protein [Butyrivibrio sp.]
MQKYDNYVIPAMNENAQKYKLSVIVTAYNLEKYISRCLDSLIRQTYKNLEIIVSDNGSTDSTGRICDEYASRDARIKVIHMEKNGAGGGRNAGLDAATGDFIAFTDGDDFIDPYMMEKMMSAIVTFNADMAVCRYRQLGIDEDYVEKSYENGMVCVLDNYEMLRAYCEEDERLVIQNALWNKVLKREYLEGIRMWENRKYEDVAFSLKMIKDVGKTVYIDTPMYNYIIDRSDSGTNDQNYKTLVRDQFEGYREKDKIFKDMGKEDLMYIHQYFTCKKMLVLYTEAKKAADEGSKEFMKEVKNRIVEYGTNAAGIYSCPVADKHHVLRMKLFLISPVLYNIFTEINNTVVLPLKMKIKNMRDA